MKARWLLPGIRPGKPTTEYLSSVLNKIILIGAIGLIFIATVPIVFRELWCAGIIWRTSVIIVAGVVLDYKKK